MIGTYNSLYLEKPANVFQQYQTIVCELYIKKLRIIIQKKRMFGSRYSFNIFFKFARIV